VFHVDSAKTSVPLLPHFCVPSYPLLIRFFKIAETLAIRSKPRRLGCANKNLYFRTHIKKKTAGIKLPDRVQIPEEKTSGDPEEKTMCMEALH
jgi:hypothetical protein